MRLFSVPLFAVVVCCAASSVRGQSPRMLNADGVTLGGRTDWSDELIFHDWRIQRHAVMGHCRLLDSEDRLVARGSFADCLRKLNVAKIDQRLAPLPKDVVIVLHGLGGYRHRMNRLADRLKLHGFTVLNFGYASTRGDVAVSAKSLASVVRNLEGVETISFVAHSMGNIVIRRYLYDFDELAPERRPPVAFKRMVMITPPNHGAEILDTLDDREFVQRITQQRGGPYVELSPRHGWRELAKTLATPSFEFGIIAGGRGDDVGYDVAIPGDDDGLLSIATMRLDGAADYLQTGGRHGFMPDYQEVCDATINFLRHGYFVSAEAREPLLARR